MRLEIQGSNSSVMVGLDEKTALTSAEAEVTFPGGEPHQTFAERFDQAYRSEMVAFVELVMGGERENPCTPGRRSSSLPSGRCGPGIAGNRYACEGCSQSIQLTLLPKVPFFESVGFEEGGTFMLETRRRTAAARRCPGLPSSAVPNHGGGVVADQPFANGPRPAMTFR